MIEKWYLKGNVVAEPLCNYWYAWTFLIQPITASFLTQRQLRILESYLVAPEIHADAAKKGKLRGGAFMSSEGSLENVQALVDSTKSNLNQQIELAEHIRSFDRFLQEQASGFAVEELYEKLPGPLKGYVEIVYDLHNRPKLRFFEKLLYLSDLYNDSLQSVSLSLGQSNYRPFVLSSPRFEQDDNLHISLPFADPLWDQLFDMRWEGKDPHFIEQWVLSLPMSQITKVKQKGEFFQNLFTNQAPAIPTTTEYKEDGVRVRYFGHATVMVQSADVSVMTDPIISYVLQESDDVEGFTFYDIPNKLDYVMLTHNHQDHVMFETLLQLRSRIGTIVVPKNSGGDLQDPSLKLTLNAIGFDNVIEIGEMDEISLADGKIIGLPFLGEHGDLDVRSKLAFCLQLKDRSMLFAADSNCISPELYQHVKRHIGNIDQLFIGMECAGAPMSWLYGPLYTIPLNYKFDQSRRLNGSNYERAMQIVNCFQPKGAYIYAMGAEPWLKFISSIDYEENPVPMIDAKRFVDTCRTRDIESEILYGKHELIL